MKDLIKNFKTRRLSVNIIVILTFLTFLFAMFSFLAVASGETAPVTIDSLINDTMLDVNNVSWNYDGTARVPQNSEWATLQNSNKPLNVNETYIEDFSKSFFESRLRPYTATYSTPDVPLDATYKIVEKNGKKSVVMETNGVAGGVYDYIEFAGMKFVDGATYTVSVDYTVVTPSRLFKMGFGANAGCDYFMDLSGTAAGQQLNASGSFSTSGLGADIHANLILLVAGGNDPASIGIDKITIKRLPSKPKALNLAISGKVAVGEILTLSYNYYQDSNIEEGNSEIIWFTASDRIGTNMSLISATSGKKTITVSSAMAGCYVGAFTTLKTVNPSDNGMGDSQIIVTKTPVGSLTAYGPYALDQEEKSITENFEDISIFGNISFKADKGVTSYITDNAAEVIAGKSLVIKSQGGMKGGIFGDIKLTGGKKYVVSFDYKFLGTAPTNLQVQFRSPTLGYSADIYQRIASPVTGTKGTFTSNVFTLGDAEDFYLQIFDAYGPYTVIIDNLKIECIKPAVVIPGAPETTADNSTLNDLATIGMPFTENFTKNALGNLWSYDMSHFSVVNDVQNIAGNSIKQDYTNATFGGIYAFDTKGKLVAGAKYKVTLSYKFLSDTAPTGMYFGFTRDGGANQKNLPFDFSGKVKNTVYTFTNEYVLDNFSDYYVHWFNLNGKDGTIIVIDSLTIERVRLSSDATEETVSDASTLADLATIGKPFTENFTKNALGSLWSYDMSHFSVVSDTAAIAGKSIKQNFTNASFGGIYAFDTKGKLTAGAKYRIKVNYKFISNTAPTGMYFGFTRDGGANQKNLQIDFSGKVKDTVYTFTGDYTLDNFSDYYLQWFNLNGKDGSIIVIDTLIIERIA